MLHKIYREHNRDFLPTTVEGAERTMSTRLNPYRTSQEGVESSWDRPHRVLPTKGLGIYMVELIMTIRKEIRFPLLHLPPPNHRVHTLIHCVS